MRSGCDVGASVTHLILKLAEVFDIVTLGSSFHVCNLQEALEDSKRILKQDGWQGVSNEKGGHNDRLNNL